MIEGVMSHCTELEVDGNTWTATVTRLPCPHPLFWGHVNPYGRFGLDMTTRINILS